jgi:hypothetical protein
MAQNIAEPFFARTFWIQRPMPETISFHQHLRLCEDPCLRVSPTALCWQRLSDLSQIGLLWFLQRIFLNSAIVRFLPVGSDAVERKARCRESGMERRIAFCEFGSRDW